MFHKVHKDTLMGLPKRTHWLLLVLLTFALVIGSLPHIAQAQNDQHCFPETNFCISGRIREYWEQNGGLPVFGFPITPQREEIIEGQPFQVQWFERNRLELHPENARPYDVLLGRLSADFLEQQGRDWNTFPKGTQMDDGSEGNCLYFEQTGQNVCGDILAMWQANGLEMDGVAGFSYEENLALFGLPLSGEQQETLEDGNTYTVQWFERARFELHPENEPPYNVLLGLLGNLVGPPDVADTPSPGKELAQVEVGNLIPYTHSSGIFSMQIPENWTSEETQDPDVLTVVFTDPTVNGAIAVTIFEVSSQLDDLGGLLRQGIESGFADQRELQINEPVAQPNGSVQITFSYKTTAQGMDVVMLGNSAIRQDENLVSITWDIIPQSQHDRLRGPLDGIAQSYQVNTAVSLP
jgi:hypothetical protein